MKRYEPAEMEIVWFSNKEVLLTTMIQSGETGDNPVDEILPEEGGIFGL